MMGEENPGKMETTCQEDHLVAAGAPDTFPLIWSDKPWPVCRAQP